MHADAEGPAEPDTARASLQSGERRRVAAAAAAPPPPLPPPLPPLPPPPRPSAPRPPLRPSPASPVLHVDAVRRAGAACGGGGLGGADRCPGSPLGVRNACGSRIAAGRAERLWEEEEEGGRGQVEEGGTGEVAWYQRILKALSTSITVWLRTVNMDSGFSNLNSGVFADICFIAGYILE
jgi:hypothetical protein